MPFHPVSILVLIGLACRMGVAQKPNIIVIFTDDLYYRGVGYNNPEVKTPNLDKLATEGLIFNRAYVASPICAASRAAMMTGVYPQQNGVIALDAAGFSKFLTGGSQASQTLGYQMSQAGYHTAFWGKSHLGDPRNYGFSEGQELGDVLDVATFAKADSFFTRAMGAAKPFFLWLAPHQPHVPLRPAAKWLALYDEKTFRMDSNFRVSPLPQSIYNQGTPGENFYRDSDYRNNWLSLPSGPPRVEDTIRLFKKAYYAAISQLDDQVGTLVQQLKARNLYANTALVFLSDNGYHLGTHGLGNKLTMHEESVRIPLFIHWAGLPAKGRRTDALVSSLDLYPTLMELAGTKAPTHLMGRSLLPLLENPSASIREVVFSEAVGIGGKAGQGHRMARGDKWKYVLTDTDEPYLFDEVADKWELTNLFGKNGAGTGPVLVELQQAMGSWMRKTGDRPYPYHPPTGRYLPGQKHFLRVRDLPGEVYIDLSPGESASLQLTSLAGEAVASHSINGPFRLRKDRYLPGIHVLRIKSSSRDLSARVVF